MHSKNVLNKNSSEIFIGLFQTKIVVEIIQIIEN